MYKKQLEQRRKADCFDVPVWAARENPWVDTLDCDVARQEHLWWDEENGEEESEEEDTASLVACFGMTMRSSNIKEPNIAKEAVS